MQNALFVVYSFGINSKKLPTDSQNIHNVAFDSVSGELTVAIGSSQLAFFGPKWAARSFML